MILYRLDGEVVNLSHMANALDKLGKLAERNFLPITTILDHCYKGVAV